MTPETARGVYRRQIAANGESVSFRRVGVANANCKARVLGYKPEELGGGINQGDRRVIVMADDIPFAGGLRRGDEVWLDNGTRKLTIMVADRNTRKVADTVIAYDVAARG